MNEMKGMKGMKAMKLKNDYEAVAIRVRSLGDWQSLLTLAKNIRARIAKDDVYKSFAHLAEDAKSKGNKLRILEKCPLPFDGTLLERIAFNNFVKGTAFFNKMPSTRVIHLQLKKLGYAKTMARQVEKSVGNAMFFDMAKKGIVKHTSEYFVYKYAKHLVKPSTYQKIADLFKSNKQLLEVT